MINKTLLCFDHGIFQSVAHRLARDFKRVFYFRPWQSSFSHPNDLKIGAGYDDIEKVETWLDLIDEVDIFCFPDIGFPSEQEYLRSIGKAVWGAGNGEELEMLRGETKELMKEIGLPVQPWEAVVGMDALREFLKEHENWHVKVSRVRGLCESFESKSYELSKPKLDSIEHELGGMAEVQEFIVEQGIPDAIEVGYDGYCIDGAFPKTAVYGVEVKDCGYAAMVKPYSMIPKECQIVNQKLAPVMKDYGYRGFFSTEIRIGKDKKPYLIDVTARAASPAGECYQELYENFGEIVHGGSRGILVEPVCKFKFAAQAILISTFADENWLPINVPDEIRNNVKLYHSCKLEGQEYIVPTDADMIEIGSIVATGNILDEAIKKVQKYAGMVEAFGLKCKTDSLKEAKTELSKA